MKDAYSQSPRSRPPLWLYTAFAVGGTFMIVKRTVHFNVFGW